MALIAEDNYFNARLHEINDEMQKLLDRTSRQRDDLLRPSPSLSAVTSPSATRPDDARHAKPSDAPMPASLTALGPLERAFVEQEMRQLCREEMTRWMATDFPKMVTQAVEREVEKRLADVLRSTEKMQDSQDASAAAVTNLQKEWKDALRELQEASRQAELHQRRLESTLRAETERYVSAWRTDMDLMKDTISGVERNAALLERREEKRVAALAERHLHMVHDKLSALSGEVESWKAELYGLLRQEVATWREQRVELDAQLARCEGAQRAQVEATAHHTVSVTRLLEGDVEQRAEMRRCRRDVNRLEMLVQCAGVSESGAARLERAAAHESASASLPAPAIVQELFLAQDRLGFLAGRVEAMERRLHQVDHFLLVQAQQLPQRGMSRGGGGIGGGEQAAPHAWDAFSTPWPAHSAHREAPRMTSATTTTSAAFGDSSQPTRRSPTGQPEVAETRPTGASSLRSGSDGAAQQQPLEAPHSAGRHPQTADVDRPMPTSTAAAAAAGPRGTPLAERLARRGYLAADSRPLAQRRPPPVVLPASSGSDVGEALDEAADVDSYVSATPALASQSPAQHSSRFSSPLGLASSRHSSQRPASRSPRERDGAFESGRAAPESVSVTPHDSYMSASASRRGSPAPSQSAASQGQYTPAPGSDTESDISNQKLSRLALD